MAERLHEAWVIGAAGEDTSRRFDVPVEIGELRPWIRVRPLTAREALQREALGLEEQYSLGPDGAAVSLQRRYDHEAMVEFELQRCLVDYELPARTASGEVVIVTPDEYPRAELLERLPVALIDWLTECLDTVNMRTPEGAEVLAEGKGG
ncbi:MAG: hypothetical protein R6V07_13880 [Armatimonadota bacterium]